MKGRTDMTLNPTYAELLGKELQRDRLREAEKERLINLAINRNPIRPGRKVLATLSSNWRAFWKRIIRKRDYMPLSEMPEKSPSI
jgi:hypothetical protein